MNPLNSPPQPIQSHVVQRLLICSILPFFCQFEYHKHTQIGQQRVHEVRTRGGNSKYRALRLDHGNFAWASEGATRKTRIIDVVFNASNNELVRTKTLVKNAIIVIDATPFRQWYEAHYILPMGRKRETKQQLAEDPVLGKQRCKKTLAKYAARQRFAKVEQALEEQFSSGRVLGKFLFGTTFFVAYYLEVELFLSLLSDVKNISDPKTNRFAVLVLRTESHLEYDHAVIVTLILIQK